MEGVCGRQCIRYKAEDGLNEPRTECLGGQTGEELGNCQVRSTWPWFSTVSWGHSHSSWVQYVVGGPLESFELTKETLAHYPDSCGWDVVAVGTPVGQGR